MALLHGDGFDVYGTTATLLTEGIYTAYSGVTISATNPRTGTYAARASSVPASLRWATPASAANFGVSYAIYMATLPTADQAMGLVSFRDSTNAIQVSLWVTTSGTIQVYSGDYDGTLLGETEEVLTAATYTNIEVWIKCDTTEGEIRIGVGDSSTIEYSVLHLSGIDTSPETANDISYIQLFNRRTSNAALFDVDDLAIYDNTGTYNNTAFIGDSVVVPMSPTADTASADFAKSTGTDGYALVDNIPPDDTVYISTASPNAKSRFTMGNVSTSLYRVRGIVLHSRQKKTGGTVSSQISLKSGSDLSAGTARNLTTSFAYYRDVFNADPATDGVWTVTSLNTAELEVKKVV